MAQERCACRIASPRRRLSPERLEGTRKVLLGRQFDDGDVMLDLWEGTEAVYSPGSNADVSWDMDMAARDILTFLYDHTIERVSAEHPQFKWERVSVAGRSNPEMRVAILRELIHADGHEDATNLFLECDIEGSQWDLFGETSTQGVRKFRSNVTKVHELDKMGADRFAETIRRTLTNLRTAHSNVDVHGNSRGNWFVDGGMPLPMTLELTLARIDAGTADM
jgi:hypothetical protein